MYIYIYMYTICLYYVYVYIYVYFLIITRTYIHTYMHACMHGKFGGVSQLHFEASCESSNGRIRNRNGAS